MVDGQTSTWLQFVGSLVLRVEQGRTRSVAVQGASRSSYSDFSPPWPPRISGKDGFSSRKQTIPCDV